VVGVDFTVEQLVKSRRLAAELGFDYVEFVEGRIESLPAEDESFDCVISNGVINLSPEKERVSPRRHACYGRAVGSPSPTSSPKGS
jgi:arsenite methyltransferase